ncbi:family 16 glycosylhydrolase, partial [Halorubrum sp. AD140]|uniref:family 16 glycosylhydrolase n=1 Tax=Halorubrum sp. AD140 TaxID=3050073 RepID=UPI002ACC4249
MHPANTNWPPEIDVAELFQRGDAPETGRRSLNVNVHWSASGEPNDRETHEDAPSTVDVGVDLTESFNRYGCAWFEDRVEWYFNGERIAARSSPPAMISSLTAGAARPFGLIFSN